MANSLAQTNLARVQREIIAFSEKDAQEARKASDTHKRIARLTSELARASGSRVVSISRDLERAQDELARIAAKRSDLSSKVAAKYRDVSRYQRQVEAERERERKQLSDAERRDRDAQAKRVRDLETRLAYQQRSALTRAVSRMEVSDIAKHDVFISHASEDKDAIVRDLADALSKAGLEVWYDEFSLQVGDSLRRSIDHGLGTSKFGVVVLSPAFFENPWPQHELDGLVQREVAGKTRILPIWHKVTRDEVREFSPALADKLALNTTTMSAHEIAMALVEVIRPGERIENVDGQGDLVTEED